MAKMFKIWTEAGMDLMKPWTEEEATRFHFLILLKTATYLHHTTVKQVPTSLSYIDILTIMSKRSGLQEDYADMENKLDNFINYDDKFVDQPQLSRKFFGQGHDVPLTLLLVRPLADP